MALHFRCVPKAEFEAFIEALIAQPIRKLHCTYFDLDEEYYVSWETIYERTENT